LRILITNNTLAERAGSELYVRDVAQSLLKRGHTPIAYSANLGEVAKELRALTIPIVDNLDLLSTPPDLIHGQHHVETMTALLRFPNVPAVFVCHGWLPLEETPPRFPRILRYVAVDHAVRDRLIYERAIPEERVRVILNFVDLQRFKVRGPLPAKPRRALVFSNKMSEGAGLGAVREACAREGIALDAVGMNAGGACARPEELLGRYDLVFAKARCALEAMAAGTAVVLCDTAGVGPLVTTGNLERLRPFNFGIRILQEGLTPDALAREIARYDPEDAREVSRRIRATAPMEAAVDELVALYEEVLAEHQNANAHDAEAEGRAAATYLRWLAEQIRKERESLENSTTARLRERVLRLPLVGPVVRSLARKTLGR
jgi:hypothetical protein